MIIKNFKIFESSNFDYPSLEEVREYFYDFTDDNNSNIDYYTFGYLYFDNRGYENKTVKSKEDYGYRFRNCIDVLDTELTNDTLDRLSDVITLNLANTPHKNRLKLIESGEEKGYPFLLFSFDNSLFEKSKMTILEDCLRTVYSQTGFRPVKLLWEEDCYIEDQVITKYGFEGLLINVSDEEYEKIYEIFQHKSKTKIIKLF